MNEVAYLPHQEQAIDKLRSGSILCAGVGTGKSITALGYFFERVCGLVRWSDGQNRGPLFKEVPLYIITTARKRDTGEWKKEYDKFGFEVPLVIDSWNNLWKYTSAKDSFFIFDEQRVVGSGKWVREFYRVVKNNQWILLTATPGDTWEDYIPVFVANGFYRNRTEFLRRHAVYSPYVTKYPKIERWDDTVRLEMLRRKITVTMRFEKHTIPHFMDIYTEYDREKYRLVSEERWNPYDECPVQDIAEACRLMRRIVNEDGSRMAAIEDLMKKHEKLIIFYNFDYELEMLRTFSNVIAVGEWNGHHHQPIPSSNRWIYLVQYSAGAEGWNCTETDAMAFFSQNYSYKMMTQAAGRIDRMNTSYTDLYYYTLRSHSTIDAAIAKTLKGKKNFNERLFAKQTNLGLSK